MKTLLIFMLSASIFLPPVTSAIEEQSHGLLFEQWLRKTFFGGYEPQSHTQKWDIPAEANLEHGRIPVNPKAIKRGTPIGLGDALRQFEINEPFMLIVGFWEQVTPKEKRWMNVQVVTVVPDQWARLWWPITKADIERLAAVIKDKSLSLETARIRAQEIKSQPPFSAAIIQVNPKIDGSQRRLQCSLKFDDFFKHLAPDASPVLQANPQVFGVDLPARIESAPRQFSPP